jgi:hypothetical protein
LIVEGLRFSWGLWLYVVITIILLFLQQNFTYFSHFPAKRTGLHSNYFHPNDSVKWGLFSVPPKKIIPQLFKKILYSTKTDVFLHKKEVLILYILAPFLNFVPYLMSFMDRGYVYISLSPITERLFAMCSTRTLLNFP